MQHRVSEALSLPSLSGRISGVQQEGLSEAALDTEVCVSVCVCVCLCVCI
jgi:hypothetical protein